MFFQTTSTGALKPSGPIAGAGLKALRQARADLRHVVAELADTTGGRAQTPVEKATLESARRYAVEIADALDLAEARNEAERTGVAIEDPDDLAAQRAARSVPGLLGTRGDRVSARPTGKLWHQMFPTAARAANPWQSEAEFLETIASGRADPRLQLQAQVGTMSSGDGASGLVVPDEFIAPWMDLALASEIVRPRATVWPMASATRTIAAWDTQDRTGGSIGGLIMQWVGEGTTQAPQVAKPRTIKLNAKKGAIYVELSNELLADGLAMDQQLRLVLAGAVSVGLDSAFLYGPGAGAPLGAFTGGAAIAVPRESAGTVVYDDLTSMFSRLAPASVKNSVWVASPSCIPALSVLAVVVGAGGSAIPVMKSSDGSFEILTRPVIFSDLAKPVGTPMDIALADFTQYQIGIRREASIETSAHVGFMRDTINLRILVRLDGQPSAPAPQQPVNGPTQSAFVTLD